LGGKVKKKCEECGGSGELLKPIMFVDPDRYKCPNCNGSGEVLDIDCLKWCVDKAEGWSHRTCLVNTGIIKEYVIPPQSKNVNYLASDRLDDFILNAEALLDDPVYYPLLLGRVIEGINRDKSIKIGIASEEDFIRCRDWGVDGCRNGRTFYYNNYSSIDQAKEAVIRYVYDREVGE
jgi:hypothetical protein